MTMIMMMMTITQVLREAERDRADVKRYSVAKAEKIKIGFIVTLSFAQYLQGGKHDRTIRAFVIIALAV